MSPREEREELPKGKVPLLGTGVEGDAETRQIGWMPLEEWKAKLKSLHVRNYADAILPQSWPKVSSDPLVSCIAMSSC